MVNVNEVIRASDLNNIINKLNTFWGDIYQSNTPNSNKSQNRLGWGQGNVSTVNIGDIIFLNKMNSLINLNNISHEITNLGSSLSTLNTGEIIKAVQFNNLEDSLTPMVNNPNSVIYNTITSGGSAGSWEYNSWNNYIYITIKVRFNSFKRLRYFFNSGGQIRISFSNSGTTKTAKAWQELFDSSNMGTLIFSLNDVSQTGQKIGTIFSPSGVYDTSTSNINVYSNSLGGSGSSYNIYSEDDIKVDIKRNSDGSEFYITVRLNNDDPDADTVNGTTKILVDTKKADDYTAYGNTFHINPPTISSTGWSGN